MKKFFGYVVLCLVSGSLFVGCASSAPSRRVEALEDATVQRLKEKTAFEEAAEQYLRDSAKRQGTGSDVVHVSGKDPVIPMFECMDYGCPATVKCAGAKAHCSVTHCGKGSCNFCPSPVPDAFKNLVFKQWCEYECLRGPVRVGTVIGFVPSIGAAFIGPFGCPEE